MVSPPGGAGPLSSLRQGVKHSSEIEKGEKVVRTPGHDDDPTSSAAGVTVSSSTSNRDRTVVVMLYASHLLSSWGDRMWEFAVPIIFASMFTSHTMVLAALFALVEQASGFLFGAAVGSWIDVTSRLRVVTTTLLSQNISIVISCAIFAKLLDSFQGLPSPPYSDPLFLVPYLVLLLLGGISSVTSMGERIAISKDWVPTMFSRSTDVETAKALNQINAALRRINLICAVASPLAVGLIMRCLSHWSTVLFLGAWNVCSFFPELLLLRAIHSRCTHFKESPGRSPTASPTRLCSGALQTFAGWKDYAHHRVMFASLSYVFLYITVLSPGVLMAVYLAEERFPPYQIAIFNGVSSVAGIVATVVVAPAISRWGQLKAGSFFLFAQLGFLIPAVVFLFAAPQVVGHDATPSWMVYVFLLFLTISRMGLWGFDLVETLVMQRIDKEKRGAINGVEGSLVQLASMLPFAAAVCVDDAVHFPYMVLGSLVFIVAAVALWQTYVRKERQRQQTTQRTSPQQSHTGDILVAL